MRSALGKRVRMLSTQSTMRHSYFKAWAFVFVLAITLVSRAQRVPTAYGYNINGQPITRLAARDTEAVILFFVASDCPISNRYIPELQRIENKFAAQHVVFWFVYPNVGETPEAVRQHEAAYGAEKNILLDPHHQLVALTHATVTPESPLQVPASGTDLFRNFILPLPITQTKYIRAMEIKPGAPRVVHHANVLIDRTASLRHQHPDDWKQGIPGMELTVDPGKSFDPDSHFLFWKPIHPLSSNRA